MKALIRAPFDPDQLERLNREIEVEYDNWMDGCRLLSSEEFIRHIEQDDIGILVVEADFVQREVFEQTTKLKLLGVCRGDAFQIDVKAATECGVIVVNTPARNANAVAELSLGLMLSLARRIPSAHNIVSSGSWMNPTEAYFSMRGTEISGKTVGIVGLGAIGRRLAGLLKGFDVRILACDPYVKPEVFNELSATAVPLDELMCESDFVAIHCSTVAETAGLINARRIALMKPTAFLVNAASSYVIDEDAVVQALKEKKIAGAGFDVYSTWPVRPDSPLLKLDNVVLTPHTGGATAETITRHSKLIVDDIERFLNGERPKNFLNPEVWNG